MINQINKIEIVDKSLKFINLSTYFFKQVVKEEVENAEYNN